MSAIAARAEERGEGICRTCLEPIWNEGGMVGGRRKTEGWSDRIERGGDSLVCFKAVEYRHVPLTGREACIYDRAYERGATAALATLRTTVERLRYGSYDDVAWNAYDAVLDLIDEKASDQ